MSVPSPGWAGAGTPSSAGEAPRMAAAGLGWLATADAASLPAAVQADALRALERLQSLHIAARAKVLEGFAGQRGFEDDGQGSARTWLTWQTRITAGAARAAVGWMRRLQDHPAVAGALAGGAVSASWARAITGWTDTLPVGARRDADVILLAAAAGGADLAGLAELAEELRRRVGGPSEDGDDGFLRRSLQLETTFGGVGRLTGNLSARCATALREVLDSLGKKMGPEDTRTVQQRDHDALEDACVRLLGSACLPERACQPVRLQLNLSLEQLLEGIGKPGRAWLPPGFGQPPPAPASLAGPRLTPHAAPGGPGDAGWSASSVPPGPWAGPGMTATPHRPDRHRPSRPRPPRPARSPPRRDLGPGDDPARTPCARGGLPGCAGGAWPRRPCRVGQRRGQQRPGRAGPPGRSCRRQPRARSSCASRWRCCPGLAAWRPGCGPGHCRRRRRPSACRWTLEPSLTSCRRTCAARSSPGTGTAPPPAATPRRWLATCITSFPAARAAPRASETASCSARSTTSYWFTGGAGLSPCTPTAPPRPGVLTDGCCVATARQPLHSPIPGSRRSP